MTEKLKQIIKEEITKLPKELQEVINVFDWVKISEEIGKEFLLSENEINNFQAETLVILVGLEDPSFYSSNIENNIGTSKNEAEKIAEEVNQKIFIPISETIKKSIKEKLSNKKSNWKQSLDFILSGGDYSVFLEKENNLGTTSEFPKTNTLDNSQKINDIKNKFVI